MTWKPHPKPAPKPKKEYGGRYWANLRSKSVKNKLDNAKEFLEALKIWHRKIYDKYKGICAESGRHLRFNKGHCCHILPKAMYENFALDERNGILLATQYHDILDHGSAKQRKELKVWSIIRERRKKLLYEVGEEYDEDYWLKLIL